MTHFSGHRQVLSSSLLVAFLLLITVATSVAQPNYENPKKYIIGGIQVSGTRNLNKGTLVSLSKLDIGDEIQVPGDDITNAVRKLWEQDMFSDVQILTNKIEGDTIYLEISLKEQPRLSEIIFTGTRKTEEEDLKEEIALSRGGQVTENTLKHSKNIIRDYFREKGYAFTKVSIIRKVDTAYINAVKLNVLIDKGKKTRIENIFFEGNTVFSDAQLKRKMFKDTKEKRWWGLFKPSKYDDSKYEDDKVNLIAEYNKEGYRDAEIVVDSVYEVEKDNVEIYVKIKEGKQYFFRDIKWVGNKKYKTALLQKRLEIEKGDVYNKERLTNRLNVDEDAVGNLYMDNGYLFFHINPVITAIDNDSVDLELQLYEGPKARISRVVIKGNDRTNDHVIRREIRTLPGSLFSKRDIIRSVRELAQLGHFDPEQIVPNPIPHPETGTVDIEYNLVERGNDRVEISGGWGQNMLVGSVGLSFNNFSVHNLFDKESWAPLPTGDGQQFSIRMQTNGKRYQYYSVSFVEPWLGGKKPNSLSVSLYHNLQSNGYAVGSSLRRDANISGISVGFGRRLQVPDDYFTLSHKLGFQRYDLNEWTYFQTISNGVYNSVTLNTTFSRNSVDNPLYSRRGSSFSLSLELTPPYSLMTGKDYSDIPTETKFEWIEYHKWVFKGDWYSQMAGDLVLHTKTEFGMLGFYNQDIGYSPLGGFSLGGDGMGYYSYGTDIIGLRGYENGKLTPSNGGNIYAKYALELRYPVVLSESATIYGMVFGEAGNSWYKFDNFNPFNIYRSAGVGARIFLPMLGMLGFDWGYGFDSPPGTSEPSGGQFHFTMGQQF
ncbi:MAG: outer membrane protein assembly factor BamA [Bacteroidota bacterium]|nr:outer membrane protein assembly factor BamA [Bacteroidota bacterium]